jgi:L-amino acid N-acyltransferase YncA
VNIYSIFKKEKRNRKCGKMDFNIRVATVQDTQELLNIYEYYVLNTAISFEYEVPTVEEFKTRIENTLLKYPYLVAESNSENKNEIIGYAYASAFKSRPAYDWAVETSIYVKYGLTKSGVGKRLYQELERYLKMQNITNMNACIAVPEVEDEYCTRNSRDFHEHIGFNMVGEFHKCGYKFNRWYNMVWLEKIIGEHTTNQKDIVPFRKLL